MFPESGFGNDMKKLHLICNAHIDPVWQWTWDEGISAAIATFKSAADIADEYDYIFCHGESLLYEEIEKKAPSLFKRIQKLVKDGKWVITGGWYLQPDCLLPSGESFVRQIETGREYFGEKFGVYPEIATNYDSFGYSAGLPQILKKCGFKGMLVCRPNAEWQFKFPSRFFKWISPDGSEIIVSNSSSYNSLLGHAVDKIKGYIGGEAGGMLGSEGGGKTTIDDVDYVLWGVGNHGGGPSRKDISDIAELKKELEKQGIEIMHSTPERLFADDIKTGGEVKTSLTPCMPGCYSSMMKLKQAHKEAESLFYATEKMLAAAKMAGYEPDLTDWKVAEKKLLLAEFHDILPGTTIADGEHDGMELLGMCKKIVKDYRSGAFLYLVMGEHVAETGEFPIFVFNYMPYEVETPVEAEFSLADQNWSEEFHYTPHVRYLGEEIPCQVIKEESTLNLDWRKRIAFNAKLKPLGITRFSVTVTKTPVKKEERREYSLDELLNGTVLKRPVELEIGDDSADPWAMSAEELKGLGKNFEPFNEMDGKEAARFCGFKGEIPSVHTIEDGNVFTAVESLYEKDRTCAAVEYKVYKNKPFIDLKVTLEYSEKNRLIRLKVPAPEGVVFGDGAYVVEDKPAVGEITFHKWLGVKGKNDDNFAVINSSVYGGTVKDGYLCFTLVRGAGYCIHPICDRQLYPTDRYMPRIEGGRYVYNFRIMTGSVGEIATEAELFNEKPYVLNVFPTGEGSEYAEIKTNKPVIMSVMRIFGNGYEMRFFNPKATEEKFELSVCGSETEVKMSPFEIKTLLFKDGKFTVKEDIISFAKDRRTLCYDI